MNEERDPFAEKLHQKERAEEDIFFARRDRALLEELRHAREEERRARLRGLTHMRCPDCASPLERAIRHGITVSECPAGHGMWIADSDMRAIPDRSRHAWIGRYIYRPRPESLVG